MKSLRESRGMTREQLGAVLGLGAKDVEGIESGRSSNIRADEIKLLCETFRVHPDFLLYGRWHGYRGGMTSSGIGGKKDGAGLDSSSVSNRDLLLQVRNTIEDVIESEAFPLMNSIYFLSDEGLTRAETLIGDLLKIREYRKSPDSPPS